MVIRESATPDIAQGESVPLGQRSNGVSDDPERLAREEGVDSRGVAPSRRILRDRRVLRYQQNLFIRGDIDR